MAGAIGTAVFYYVEKAVYDLVASLPSDTTTSADSFFVKYLETVSFNAAYLVSIVPQHVLNAVFCYGMDTINTRRKYWSTLIGTYSALGFTLALSTIINILLIQGLRVKKDSALGLTLGAGAVLNYVLLTYIINDDEKGDKQAKIE
uniref:Uncharacterized protein n=1 Tax=Craspedostauros australis TaxID=1486917 RepID=A0A7R9WTC9_9STRA|mmetsp:Transcript_20002/g.55656  ORF Transcript_20002/g.55656 Transcript_20002/m.55656 type:complete len:146 (+) Transcript_20002:507-944(+)